MGEGSEGSQGPRGGRLYLEDSSHSLPLPHLGGAARFPGELQAVCASRVKAKVGALSPGWENLK